MAGTLPGVEAARRRKCHRSSELFPSTTAYGGFSTRRSSLTSASSMRNPAKQELFDESKLGAEAREAKKRLDARLQHRWKSQSKRSSSEQASPAKGEPRTISKNLKWLKIKWKSSEEEECAVCLEQVKGEGESIMHLACAHKFHTKCLVPWLETNANCPCCRMKIP